VKEMGSDAKSETEVDKDRETGTSLSPDEVGDAEEKKGAEDVA